MYIALFIVFEIIYLFYFLAHKLSLTLVRVFEMRFTIAFCLFDFVSVLFRLCNGKSHRVASNKPTSTTLGPVHSS